MSATRRLTLGALLPLLAGCAPGLAPGPAPAPAAAAGPAAPGVYARELDRRQVVEAHGHYQLYLPPGYGQDDRKWPLILFLHGAGERGDELEKVAVHGPLRVVREGRALPFVIVAPQVPGVRIWSTQFLDALLNEVTERYAIDPERIYLTGLSMGGYGAWALAMEYPHRFAALAPVSGAAMQSGACSLKHLPIWVFHGAKDEIVPFSRAQDVIKRMETCGGHRLQVTLYPDAGHDAWTQTYADPRLYEWFLQHRRTPADSTP